MTDGRRAAELPLRNRDGVQVGTLHLRVPPDRRASGRRPPLVDTGDSSEPDGEVPRIQLLESEEYLYEVQLERDGEQPIDLSPREVFARDTDRGDRGRIRPGLHTGVLALRVGGPGETNGEARVEVRSRKLGYRRHYQWMLGDLAESMAELLMQRFAPTRQRFSLDETLEASTLYQRFAFLRSLVETGVFGGAIERVLRRPYRTWISTEEWRRPGRGVPAGSGVGRQFWGPGPRTEAGRLEASLGTETVPRTFRVERSEETRDNVPNRFVRFALERWRDVVTQIHDLLEQKEGSGPVERGIRECRALRDRLDAVLSRELFRASGRLERFPASNQVLQKREGYRDVFRAYVQFEAAAQLSWAGGEDVYGAGQRDVATLYEYWVFHALAREISELCDEPFELRDLIEPSDGGLHLRLERGERRILSGEVRRLGRTLDVEMWFNRTFSAATDREESWTRGMRPDCSLRICPPGKDEPFFHEDVWLHFDAKYRVDRLEEALGREVEDPRVEEQVVEEEERRAKLDEESFAPGEAAEGEARAKRADLLRMHAYRDAIRRSSGAYVVYPGSEAAAHTEYHEVLPGLGAFPLRPTDGDRPEGATDVRRFIDEVLDQVALQTTQHERARFWIETSYGDDGESVVQSNGDEADSDGRIPGAPGPRVRAAPFLEEPPADAEVLLGYVKSPEHHGWILREGLYNLRADDRTGSVDVGSDELGVRWIILYGRGTELPGVRPVSGEPRVIARQAMIERGYPSPGGELYFCLPVGPRQSYEPVEELVGGQIEQYHRSRAAGPKGLPLVVTWKELVESVVE